MFIIQTLFGLAVRRRVLPEGQQPSHFHCHFISQGTWARERLGAVTLPRCGRATHVYNTCDKTILVGLYASAFPCAIEV